MVDRDTKVKLAGIALAVMIVVAATDSTEAVLFRSRVVCTTNDAVFGGPGDGRGGTVTIEDGGGLVLDIKDLPAGITFACGVNCAGGLAAFIDNCGTTDERGRARAKMKNVIEPTDLCLQPELAFQGPGMDCRSGWGQGPIN